MRLPSFRAPLARRPVQVLLLVAGLAASPGRAAAQNVPAPILTAVVVEQEGQPVTDPALLTLIETMVGEPRSTVEITESLRHLDALNRFEQIQVLERETRPGGVELTYLLFPRRPIEQVEFRGQLGLDRGDLRRVLRERYGTAPPENRIEEAVQLLRTRYRDMGYPNPAIDTRLERQDEAFRSMLVFDIVAGMRAIVREVRWEGENQTAAGTFIATIA